MSTCIFQGYSSATPFLSTINHHSNATRKAPSIKHSLLCDLWKKGRSIARPSRLNMNCDAQLRRPASFRAVPGNSCSSLRAVDIASMHLAAFSRANSHLKPSSFGVIRIPKATMLAPKPNLWADTALLPNIARTKRAKHVMACCAHFGLT